MQILSNLLLTKIDLVMMILMLHTIYLMPFRDTIVESVCRVTAAIVTVLYKIIS